MTAAALLLTELRLAGATVRVAQRVAGPMLQLRGAPPALVEKARACKPELLNVLDLLVPWYEGVTRMQMMRPPWDFSAQRWTRACVDAAGLLDMKGAELLALGWTAEAIFGLHAAAPGPAVDCYGLAMLMNGGAVTELTAEGARITLPSGAVMSIRRGTGRPAVPAWELAK